VESNLPKSNSSAPNPFSIAYLPPILKKLFVRSSGFVLGESLDQVEEQRILLVDRHDAGQTAP